MAVSTGRWYIGTSNIVLTGSIDPTASTNVVGVGTAFLTELEVGCSILVSGETRIIATITDNTNCTVTVAFSDNANDTSPERVVDYATVTAAESDIADPLTGDLTFEHLDEETTISSAVTFDTDTATSLLKLTAKSGAEHNGGAYGNGARINFGTSDSIKLDETTDGDLANVEISKIAVEISGAGNYGVDARDAGSGGQITIDRMLMSGNSSTYFGVRIDWTLINIIVTNCIMYGLGDGGDDAGVTINCPNSGRTTEVYNNTIVDCYAGIRQQSASTSATLTVKNNLCQDNTTDFSDAGAGFGTTSKNISEDDTSPDSAYDNTDVHTYSVFENYASDDYRLDPDGDEDNLAIVDDGDDLSGTFTDDIIGQTRSTWYIGASEIVSAGAVAPTSVIFGPLYGFLRGPI